MFFGELISYFKPKAGVNFHFIENIWVVLVVELEKRLTYVCIF